MKRKMKQCGNICELSDESGPMWAFLIGPIFVQSLCLIWSILEDSILHSQADSSIRLLRTCLLRGNGIVFRGKAFHSNVYLEGGMENAVGPTYKIRNCIPKGGDGNWRGNEICGGAIF